MPLLFNWVESGKTPAVPLKRLKELRFALIIFPISALLAATSSIREVLGRIRADGSPIEIMDQLLPFGEFVDLTGMPEIRELEERFASEEAAGPC